MDLSEFEVFLVEVVNCIEVFLVFLGKFYMFIVGVMVVLEGLSLMY